MSARVARAPRRVRSSLRRIGRLGRAAAVVLAGGLLLSACAGTPDELADGFFEGSGGYGGTEVISEFAPDERVDVAPWSGPLDIGGEAASEDYLGQVVVLNFWYAGCPPCRVEAPVLEEVNEHFAENDEVVFLGINTDDEAPTALTFAEQFGVGYPSILDVQSATVRLSFAGSVPANAVPTTIVLDREGRVTARILGAVPEASILRTLVQDALDEQPSGS